MLLDFLTGNGRVGASDTGKKQTKVFVDFRRGANGASGIARDDFLLNGDSGRNAFDEVALRFVHAS